MVRESEKCPGRRVDWNGQLYVMENLQEHMPQCIYGGFPERFN